LGVGDKFAAKEESGVWEVTEKKNKTIGVRCIFGDIGVEAMAEVETECYLIDSRKDAKILIVDEMTEEVILEIDNPQKDVIEFMTTAETLSLKAKGRREKQTVHVVEYRYQVEENRFYIMVMQERSNDEKTDRGNRDCSVEQDRRDTDNGVESRRPRRKKDIVKSGDSIKQGEIVGSIDGKGGHSRGV
jgi:hypothetical protein